MRFELDIDRRNLSDQTLLDDVVGVAQRLGTDSPTIGQYEKYGSFAPSTLMRRFGGWRTTLLRANLKAPRHNGGIDVAEAISDLKRVGVLLNRKTVTQKEYIANGRFSSAPFVRTFGS